MNSFLIQTMSDMRGGRQTWRVIVALGLPSFAVAIVATLLQAGV